LHLTIFRQNNSSVVFQLAGSKSKLPFKQNDYTAHFGKELGASLYSKLEDELKACRDNSITIETIRMEICTVIWTTFGIQWLDIFDCIQESRMTTPPQGIGDLAGLSQCCVLDMNIMIC
jgi:hypothetical protein